MFKKILSSELGKGAAALFIAMNLFNILSFLFHFVLARLLGPIDYGTLAVLMSLVYIYGIPIEAIQNIITKYTSRFSVKKEDGKIKHLLFRALWKGLKLSLVLFIIASIVSVFLAEFLEINYWLIFITNVIIILAFLNPVIKGVLQGRKKFALLGVNILLEGFFKIIFPISLVLLGFKVFGAIIGVLISIVAGIVFGFYFNKDIIHKKKVESSFKGIYPESIPYFISMLVILLVFSLDIILAKRFFSPEVAGQFAVLSMLGKIIYLGTLAVSKAMFPLTSEHQESNRNPKKLFNKSFLLVAGLCFIAVICYWIIPKLIISLLYGRQYIGMAPYLVFSGLAFSFLSLSNLILIYGLSINKLKNSFFLFIFLIIEVVLFLFFHDGIMEYIVALMFSNIVMFIGVFLFIKK